MGTCCGDAVCSRQGAHHCSCETAACVDKYLYHDMHRHSCGICVCVHTRKSSVCTQVDKSHNPAQPPCVRSARVCAMHAPCAALPDPVLASARHTPCCVFASAHTLCARVCTRPVLACAHTLCSCVHRRPADVLACACPRAGLRARGLSGRVHTCTGLHTCACSSFYCKAEKQNGHHSPYFIICELTYGHHGWHG